MLSPPPKYVRRLVTVHCHVEVPGKSPLFQRFADQPHIAGIIFYEKYFESTYRTAHCCFDGI
jgi:hypothetical protein